ncbi:hypothetical protein [Dyadobacter sp. NIV53]|uniref:hypothetical protein n=1 Tax=Dyadobacter sp. NIV53 TaxID=2861765 RepID=UPI001C8770B4|nr:hypothetical protein [Dyadobacter sp. NIV53]
MKRAFQKLSFIILLFPIANSEAIWITKIPFPSLIYQEDSLSNKSIKPLHPMAKYRDMIKGSANYISRINPQQLLNKNKIIPEMGTISKRGQKVSLVAFGGGLTAGVSNGGLYREGQQFAYPNLVAIQMGITDFEAPLFEESESNGTGFLIYDDKNSELPRWKEVSNNIAAVQSGIPPKFTPYQGKVNNWAYPNGGASSAGHTHRIDERSLPLWFEFHPYLWRFLPEKENEQISAIDFVKKNQPYDLVFIEDFFDNWIRLLQNTPNINLYDFYQSQLSIGHIENAAIYQLTSDSKKAVLFTVPRYQTLPYFNWYKTDAANENVKIFVANYKSNLVEDTTRPKYFLPSENVDKFFQGEAVLLTDQDVITEFEEKLSDPEWKHGHNIQLREMAAKNNFAIVDLAKLYSDIHKGAFVTDDGLQIDGSRKGNFFSSDGIYPSPLGQAVIANEVIKAINKAYGSRIPLIITKDISSAMNLK